MDKKVKSAVNKGFSAGLGKGGRGAAWATAVAAVGAWYWYENRDNGKVFSSAEQAKWNANKAKAVDKPEESAS